MPHSERAPNQAGCKNSSIFIINARINARFGGLGSTTSPIEPAGYVQGGAVYCTAQICAKRDET